MFSQQPRNVANSRAAPPSMRVCSEAWKPCREQWGHLAQKPSRPRGREALGCKRARLLSDCWVQALLLPLTQAGGCHVSWSLTCCIAQSRGVWGGRASVYPPISGQRAVCSFGHQATGLRELSQLPCWRKGFRGWGLSDSTFVIFLKKCQCVFNG